MFKTLPKLYVDCGAYTFWKQKIPITPELIERYCDFIFRNFHRIYDYATMDNINCPLETARHYQIMRNQGLDPMHVFHRGEPIQHLESMMKGHRSFAVGGLVGNIKGRKGYLKDLAKKLRDYYGPGKSLPVHLFGMTGMDALLEEQWQSVDSTSWVISAARQGQIYLPKWISGKWDYTQRRAVVISNRTKVARKHDFNPLKAHRLSIREEILQYIQEQDLKVGSSEIMGSRKGAKLEKNQRRYWNKHQPGRIEQIIEEGLCNNPYLRAQINAKYFRELGQQLGIDIYMSHTELLPEWTKVLKEAGTQNILFSYYYISKAGSPEEEDAILTKFLEQMGGVTLPLAA